MMFMTKMTENQAIQNLYSMFPVCICFLMIVIFIISVISIFFITYFSSGKEREREENQRFQPVS